MALVTIEKISDNVLAQLVRMRLDAEGIPVHLGSEGFASLFGVQGSYSVIRVQVPETFEKRAREIVRALLDDLDGQGADENNRSGGISNDDPEGDSGVNRDRDRVDD